MKLPLIRELTWKQVRDLIRFAARRLNEERLPQVAASLTFTTVLALVPLLTIALAVFTTFPTFGTFKMSLENYFIQSLMPTSIADTILEYMNQFASQARRLSVVGAVMLVGTAVAMIEIVDRTFNEIWRVKATRSFLQRTLVYWAILTLGPLLIGISITITTYLFPATSDVTGSMPLIEEVFFTAISVLATAGAFTLLYMIVPNRAIDWRDAFCGGMLAAIAFEISKHLFAAFISKFPTYTILYGTIAAVPIFLIWVYLCWLIILTGAVVTAALPIVKYERWWHVARPGSAFVDAMALLRILYEARTHDEQAAVNSATIRMRTRLGFDESENLLKSMLDAGWVGRIEPDMPKSVQFGKRLTDGLDRWTLLANPDQLRLADVYRLFVFSVAGNAQLAKKVESAVEAGLQQTLASYFKAKESESDL